MPVNCASWSITTTPISASAANACCWVWLDPRCTTGPYRCGNRPCGSWPGSMFSTWRILAAAAAGWWTTWLEMGSRSAVTGCETSCGAWVYGRSTRNRAPRSLVIHPSDSPAWWISAWSLLWIRCGLPISPTSRCGKVSFTWLRLLIFSPEIYSAGSCQTALTRSSVWMPWRWRWRAAASQRSSTPTKAVSSPHQTSWPGCRPRRSRSAGQAGNVATTTSWWRGCGERSSTRRCTCVPIAMAGKLKSAWPTSFGGTAM